MILQNRVIVTGADGMGKSHLVRRLTQNPTGPIFPFLGHGGGPVTNQIDAFTRIASFLSSLVGIQDRCCLVDDPVYSTVFDRTPVLDWGFYDDILWSNDPLIIFVKTDNPQISQEKKEHKSASLLKQVAEQASEIQKTYESRINLLKDSGLTVLDYDWRVDPEAEHLLKRMIEKGHVCAD